MNRGHGFAAALAPLLFTLGACGPEPRKHIQIEIKDECYGHANTVLCSEGTAIGCAGGKVATRTACGELACVDLVGCRVCDASAASCDGSKRYQCNASGTGRDFVEECGAGLACSPSGCLDLCAAAAEHRSYLGCDYWPVFTSNSLLDPLFVPAVAIGNGNLVPAHVVITKNQVKVAEIDVAPSSAQTVQLSFEDALKQPGGSRLVRQGAYHLTSSVPVTVHQFNPLLFEVMQDCKDAEEVSDDNKCNSYTNDASLLFPATALRQDPELTDSTVLDFIAASRSSFMRKSATGNEFDGVPGFVAIVAVGTAPATVTVTSSAYTLPTATSISDDLIEPLAPGGTLKRTLNPGDVLQLLAQVPIDCSTGTLSANGLFCDPGSNFDMTGTRISADGPIQVVSGHDCANVPYDRPACDHLEESMVPLHAWGNSAVVTVPDTAAGGAYLLRLISGSDANTISFDPPLQAPVTLMRGQSVEFSATESMQVRGTGRLMVAQYLLGQGNLNVGDPAMSLAVPVDQYRLSYNFVSPSTYVRNFVDIIAAHDDVVTLDGKLVSTFEPVGTSNFSVATVELLLPGAHEIHGVDPVGLGIVLYGVAPYTAYLLPGGLDLQPIGTIGI